MLLKMGLKEVANEKYQQGQPDYRSSLAKVKAANPDLVFLVSYDADAILLMRQAKEIGLIAKGFSWRRCRLYNCPVCPAD